MMMRCFEVLSLLLALVSIARACNEPEYWERQMLEERASVPQMVAYGTVVSDHYLPPDEPVVTVPDSNVILNQVYWVVVQPLCWLRGGPRKGVESQPNSNATDRIVEFENITVAAEKECYANSLIRGKSYILFLAEGTKFSNFSIEDVNAQSGVLDPTNETFEAVHRGIDAAVTGYPEGECLKGVKIPCFTGERDPKVCNGGVAVGVALWFLVSAIVLAVFIQGGI